MSDYKVLFLDIDGTIIRSDDTIEDSTIHAVSTAMEKSIDVFLATGRPIHEIQGIAKELNIDSFIGYNGAYVIYKGEDLYQEPMNPETVNNILNIAKTNNDEAVFYTKSSNAFLSLEKTIVEKFIEKFHYNHNKLFSYEYINRVLGITLIDLRANDHLLYQTETGIHLSQVNIEGMRNCYDVIPDKVNKGFGVNIVLKHLGITKERAIAFGDGLNDKEMFLNVGEGIAMGNAHPELIVYAKHKTTDVNNSGIYNGLK